VPCQATFALFAIAKKLGMPTLMEPHHTGGSGSPAVRTERRCSATSPEGAVSSELPELPDFLELILLS
jgi:hypothetical protein